MRHSSADVAEAQKLHAGGWSAHAISRLFTTQGRPVASTTVRRWVDPAHHEKRKSQQTASYRACVSANLPGRLGAGPPRSPEFKLRRMTELRKTGMTFGGIALVMSFDFPGAPVSEGVVRYAVRTQLVPPVYVRAGASGT